MTPISRRFGAILLVLFVSAYGAVWWGSAAGWREDDCAKPEAFKDFGRVGAAWGIHERLDFVTDTRIQWTDGKVGRSARGEPKLTFRVIRTFDPYYLLVRPKALMPRGFLAEWDSVRDLNNADEGFPARLLFKERGSEVDFIAYLYFYRGAAVSHPFGRFLEAAFFSFLDKTRPISIVLIYGAAQKSQASALKAEAIEWLNFAHQHYEATCQPVLPRS